MKNIGVLGDIDATPEQSSASRTSTQKQRKRTNKNAAIEPTFVAVGEKKSDLSGRIDRQTRRSLVYISRAFQQSQSTVIITAMREFCERHSIHVPDTFILPEEVKSR